MLIQCSICKRIRKFGVWIKIPEDLLTDPAISSKYVLCDDCKGVNGGCERLRAIQKEIALAKEIAFWMLPFVAIASIVIAIIYFLA